MKQMEIINRTPHDITMLNEENEVIWTFPKSDEPIRLESSQVIVGEATDAGFDTTKRNASDNIFITFDVKQVVYGDSNLPNYIEDRYYIVSALVANAFPVREDLLMVNDTVRDENGRIIGCKSFAIVGLERGE